jgi:hypothetical protein
MNSGTFEIPLPRYTVGGASLGAAALFMLLLMLPGLGAVAAPSSARAQGLTRDDRGQLSVAGAASVITAVERAQSALERNGVVRPEQCELAHRQVTQTLPAVSGDARLALLHAHDRLEQLGCN